MPCYDPPYNPEWERERRDSRQWQEEAIKLRKRNELLAQLLCQACERFELAGEMELQSDELREWWSTHKLADARVDHLNEESLRILKDWKP